MARNLTDAENQMAASLAMRVAVVMPADLESAVAL